MFLDVGVVTDKGNTHTKYISVIDHMLVLVFKEAILFFTNLLDELIACLQRRPKILNLGIEVGKFGFQLLDKFGLGVIVLVLHSLYSLF